MPGFAAFIMATIPARVIFAASRIAAISFMGGIENRAVDFEGWTDENCDAVVRRVCEECGNKYFIPCIAQGGPGSVYPGVYKSLCDSIDKLNEEKFGIKASESTRLPWQIMF